MRCSSISPPRGVESINMASTSRNVTRYAQIRGSFPKVYLLSHPLKRTERSGKAVWYKGRGPNIETSSTSSEVSSSEDSDESSCDKWETTNNSNDINDHSYQRAKSRDDIDIDIITIDEEASPSSEYKENIPLNHLQFQTTQRNIILPLKKKRGRKPGSKNKNSKPYFESQKRYLTVTVKHPEKYPGLIYYKDDDNDTIFVRHTSKDVLWSSTQTFQETLEYRTLKEIYDRQCEIKKEIIATHPHMLKVFGVQL